jgi:hypothetical protein
MHALLDDRVVEVLQVTHHAFSTGKHEMMKTGKMKVLPYHLFFMASFFHVFLFDLASLDLPPRAASLNSYE